MKVDRLNESELKEILAIAQEGESKLKEMSDYASRDGEAESFRVAFGSRYNLVRKVENKNIETEE